MKNFLIGVEMRIENGEYEKQSYRIAFDMLTLKEMIDKCQRKNLKQRLCNAYNKLFVMKGERG